ncbi:hypothetical protein GobsT_08100 [Gemmata obscuriglobus]|uniref:hypothetical protein n=1 Tax=Gemmata obscuriglobus TaxID=114 RepID=UPI0011CD1C02|nr:hypothetical protein [Gemmata obscuriglobus]QEG26075.1 hypothetical protein GobsT_08100 [Gemmata obscuriglobus]VTS00508.1 Uncharacterized protein OS=Chloroflexus aggregans (strain MD-66 / DSM 9485) GN=Cagg_0005 PE=4 SV=1 [Gemmata obscuriglobus UQM 2246]
MTDELAEALVTLFERLGPYAQTDPHLRAAVQGLGRAVSAWAEQLAPPTASEPVTPAPAPSPPPPPPAPPVVIPSDFTLARPPEPSRPFYQDEDGHGVTPVEPAVVARRCRLKAEAARVVAARKRGEAAAHDDLVRRAGAVPDCDLWMLHPGDYVDAPKAWDDLGGAFAVGAEAADLLAALEGLPEPLASRHREQVLYAAAEAQALVWAGVLDVHRRADNDQIHLFIHVRERAREHRLYINRYLRKEDRVSADRWPELLARLATLRDLLADARSKARSREKSLTNLKYKLRKMAAAPAAATGDWPRVLELLEEVVAAGVPPSNVEVRELLLPVLDSLPEDLEPGPHAERAFAAATEYLATRPTPAELLGAEPPGAEVRAAADLLRGRELVLIGGVERPAARRALEAALGLSRLNWLSTRPHESVTYFEPAVARPAVAAVLLAIRWSSHSYGDVKDYCDKYGKPIVYLAAGYNPNQVAHQILAQIGERLRALGRTG